MRAYEKGVEMSGPLIDPFGRPLTHLRISVTDRCNLRCVYCHMEGSWGRCSGPEMAPADIERLVGLFARAGVRYLKLTGGEPTLRADIVEIVRRTAPLVDEVSMTTNGSRLDRLSGELKGAGLKRVNISLDTLDPASFERISSNPLPDGMMRGIEKAREVGLSPIKLNMVVLKRENSEGIWDMVEFARQNDIVLQLIELHVPREMVDSEMFRGLYYPLDEVERGLEKLSRRVERARMHRRRRFYLLKGGCVEVVRPMFNPDFCAHCYRLRVTSNGKLRPCLMRSDGIMDILTPMRDGASDDELMTVIKGAMRARRPYWDPKERSEIEGFERRFLGSLDKD